MLLKPIAWAESFSGFCLTVSPRVKFKLPDSKTITTPYGTAVLAVAEDEFPEDFGTPQAHSSSV